MAALNAAFDPLHILRPPAAKDYYDTESRFAMPGPMHHNTSPHVVVGSSIVQDFDEAYYQEKTGTAISRYFLTGGTAYEQRRMIEALLQSEHPPETVIWGVAPTSFFSGDLQGLRWGQFPEHLFQNPPSLIRYVFSYQTFYRLLRQIPDRLRGAGQDLQTRFASDPVTIPPGRGSIYSSYCGQKIDARMERVATYDYAMMEAQITHNMAPVLRANLDTRFILFLPPYSLVQFVEFDRGGALDEIMRFRALVAAAAAEFPNAVLYDFQADLDLITDDADYRDSVHYGRTTTRAMIDDMLAGRNKAAPADMPARNRRLEKAVADQRAAIWDGIYAYCRNSRQPIAYPRN